MRELVHAGRGVLECAAVQALLPSLLEGHDRAPGSVISHVEHCLSCRAELARYRKLLRLLRSLSGEQIRTSEGMLADAVSGLSLAAERHAVRSTLSKRRIAYLAGLVASIVTVSLLAGLVLRRSPRRGEAAAERPA